MIYLYVHCLASDWLWLLPSTVKLHSLVHRLGKMEYYVSELEFMSKLQGCQEESEQKPHQDPGGSSATTDDRSIHHKSLMYTRIHALICTWGQFRAANIDSGNTIHCLTKAHISVFKRINSIDAVLMKGSRRRLSRAHLHLMDAPTNVLHVVIILL